MSINNAIFIDKFNELIVKTYAEWFNTEIIDYFAEVRNISSENSNSCWRNCNEVNLSKIKLEDIFKTEMSKNWFNEFIEPLQDKGFKVHKIP